MGNNLTVYGLCEETLQGALTSGEADTSAGLQSESPRACPGPSLPHNDHRLAHWALGCVSSQSLLIQLGLIKQWGPSCQAN